MRFSRVGNTSPVNIPGVTIQTPEDQVAADQKALATALKAPDSATKTDTVAHALALLQQDSVAVSKETTLSDFASTTDKALQKDGVSAKDMTDVDQLMTPQQGFKTANADTTIEHFVTNYMTSFIGQIDETPPASSSSSASSASSPATTGGAAPAGIGSAS